MAKQNYIDKAYNLSQTIDVAIDAVGKYPPKDWQGSHVEHFIKVYLSFKDNALEPQPQFKNIQSLKSVEANVFTYFQEGSGDAVNYFWEQIKQHELPYKRQNKILEILKRKRIKDEIEYDFVTDVIVPYEQEGLITSQERELLSSLLLAFESKRK